MRKPRNDLEHIEQVKLFNWARQNESMYLHLSLLFAIPNGGRRHIGTARKLKAEGVKAGVPDCFLAVPKDEKHGLFIEMKNGKNKPTSNQNWWLTSMKVEGYETAVCYRFEEARGTIIEYMKLEVKDAR